MLNNDDLTLLKQRGVTEEVLNQQLHRFQSGFPVLRIADSARVGAGIVALSPDEEEAAIERWKLFLADGGDVAKFVPASGAASRMFKALFAFVDGEADEPKEGSDVDVLLKNIHNLAFFNELDDNLRTRLGLGVDDLIAQGRKKDVIAGIVRPEGLNYGNLPKGLLTFHRTGEGDETRTPVEEQLVEGAQSARRADGTVKLHFTVSANHKDLFAKKLEQVVPKIEKRLGVKFDISMSVQKPSTDTVAANADNTPFRDNDGNLVFRPGGHGALIENLNDIDAAVVFIKNIDNVVPDRNREATLRYKQVIAGYLILVHDKIEEYLDALDEADFSPEKLDEMKSFLQKVLCVSDERLNALEGVELADYLYCKFNRPLRVCGMVRNEGEPGGGPYIAFNPDGSASPQILESSQIDTSNPAYAEMMARATHFNPVDLVCYITDLDGEHFDLPDYVDPDTGFISSKSLQGRELKALELPGLWNGAMSDWNTVFVEVPVATFNPVKTVNDLLRPAHQG